MQILYSLVDQEIIDGLKREFVAALNLNKGSPSNENWVALKACENSYVSYIENHAAINEAELNSTKNKHHSIKHMALKGNEYLKMWLHPTG